MMYHKITCNSITEQDQKSQIYRVPPWSSKLPVTVLVFICPKVTKVWDELCWVAAYVVSLWSSLLPEEMPRNRQLSKVTVFLIYFKGENLNYVALCVKGKSYWVLKRLVLCYLSSDKARLQKPRQAILCYFVSSHLQPYLYRILIMLFSNGSSVVNTFSSDHEEISPALNHLLFTTRTRLAQKQLSCCSGRTVFFPS